MNSQKVITMSRYVSGSRALCAIALMTIFMMLSGSTIGAIIPGQVAKVSANKSSAPLAGPSTPSDVMRAPVDSPRYIILTSVDENDPYYDAVQALKDYRKGQVVKFDPTNVDAILPTLKDLQPRYVVVVVKPLEMYINFVRDFMMMSTNLDEDPFSDFSYGFITGATAQDALNFVNNIKRAEQEGIQDYPLNMSGWVASSRNIVKSGNSESGWGFETDLNRDRYQQIDMETNDTGAGRDFFQANKGVLSNNKVLDIGHNGDPHMLWLFDGGNFDPNPPLWDFDASKIEDPAYARVGLTSENISTLDLYPAVAFNGACHSGELKTVLVEGDIAATFGDAGTTARFYTMSDKFSFGLSILKTNLTGYFAPVGANNANDDGEDFFNAFLYNEPLGDIHKRSNDGVVMGFMGNRPNLRLVQEGDNTYESDILKSGDFDPKDWMGAYWMLGGKANRVYYGDPLFDPFKKDHTSTLNLTTWTMDAVNGSVLKIDLNFAKEAGFVPGTWDKFHESGARIYAAIELPQAYENVTGFSVVSSSGSYDRVIEVVERFDGKTLLHVEIDVPNSMYGAIDYDITFQITVPRPPSHGVDILGQDLSGTVMPGGTTSYEVQVKNSGELIDDIELSNSTAPTGWGFGVDFNGEAMAPGETRSAKVQVKSDAEGLAGVQSVMVLSAGIRGVQQLRDTLKVTTTIKAVYGVEILGDTLTGRARPGDDSSLTFDIKNTGNSVDSIVLSISDQTATWPTSLDFDGKAVAAGSAKKATVTVTVPIGALADTNYKFQLTARSKGNASVSDTRILNTLADPVFAVDILGSDRTCSTRPGMAVLVPVTAKNLGNAPDDIQLTSSEPPMGWSIEISFDGEKVPAGATRDGTLSVIAPSNALEGTTAFLILKALSVGNGSRTDELKVVVSVLPVAGIKVTSPSDQALAPGSLVRYVFKVTNEGNADDHYMIDVKSKNGWLTRIVGGPISGIVGPQEVTQVTVETTIPKLAQGDAMDSLSLTVSSTLDPAVSKEATVWTSVIVINKLLLTTDSDRAGMYPGQKATFNLTVVNAGNMKSAFTLDVSAPADGGKGWAALSLGTFELRVNEKKAVVLTVAPPKDSSPGTYVFTVIAKTGTATSSLNVTVVIQEKVQTMPRSENLGGLQVLAILLAVIVSFVIIIAYLYRRRRGLRPEEINGGAEDQDIVTLEMYLPEEHARESGHQSMDQAGPIYQKVEQIN